MSAHPTTTTTTTGYDTNLQQPPPSQQQQPMSMVPPNNNVSFMIPQQSSLIHAATFSSPPPASFGKTPANTPMLSPTTTNTTDSATANAGTPFMSPPPSGFGPSMVHTTTPPPVIVARSLTSPDRSEGSVNGHHATSVFGTSPSTQSMFTAATPCTTTTSRGYHRSNSSPSDVAVLFSKPAVSTTHSEDTTASVHQPLPQPPAEILSTSTTEMMSTPSIQRPTTKTAAELFGHSNSTVGTVNSFPNDATTMTETQQPTSTTTSTCTVVNDDDDDNNNNHNMSNEDELDDVPLTPGQDHVSKLSDMNDTLMNMTVASNVQPSNETLPSVQQQQHQQSIVTTGMNSLIAAIGMPPPPFSRK
jgi:hypothetical protein